MTLRSNFFILLILIVVLVGSSSLMLLSSGRQEFISHDIHLDMLRLDQLLFDFIQYNNMVVSRHGFLHIDIAHWSGQLEVLNTHMGDFITQFFSQNKSFPLQHSIRSIEVSWRKLYKHFSGLTGPMRERGDPLFLHSFASQQLSLPTIGIQASEIRDYYHIHASLQLGNRLLYTFNYLQLARLEKNYIEYMKGWSRTMMIVRIVLEVGLGFILAIGFLFYYRRIKLHMDTERALLGIVTEGKNASLSKDDDLTILQEKISHAYTHHAKLVEMIRTFLRSFRRQYEHVSEQKIKKQLITKRIYQNIENTSELMKIAYTTFQQTDGFKRSLFNALEIFARTISEWNAIKAQIRSLSTDFKRKTNAIEDFYNHFMQDNGAEMLIRNRVDYVQDFQKKLRTSLQGVEDVENLVEEMNTFADRTIILSMNIAMTRDQQSVSGKAIANVSGEIRKLGNETVDVLKGFHLVLNTMRGHLKDIQTVLGKEVQNAEELHRSIEHSREVLGKIRMFINKTKSLYDEFYHCTESVNQFFSELSQRLKDLSKNFSTISEDISARIQELKSMSSETESSYRLLTELQSAEDSVQEIMQHIETDVNNLGNSVQFDKENM